MPLKITQGSVSPLAQVVARRGGTAGTKVAGMLVHTTGGGIVADAKRHGADPEAFAVEHYQTAAAWPDYLIAHDGSTYSFGDERGWSAHAKWDDEERALYAAAEAGGAIGRDYEWLEWLRRWVNTASDGKVYAVEPSFYADWFARWGPARGLSFYSPMGIVEQVGGRGASPNSAYIGVEMLDAKPFTDAQHVALARLFADVCERWELLDPRQIEPGTLPQAWFCTHSDVSPQRRWQRTAADRKRGGMPREGCAWDPLDSQLDWRLIGALLKGA